MVEVWDASLYSLSISDLTFFSTSAQSPSCRIIGFLFFFQCQETQSPNSAYFIRGENFLSLIITRSEVGTPAFPYRFILTIFA